MSAVINVTITGTLDGLKIIDRRLAGIEARARDMRPAYGEMRAVFAQIVAQTFATEGASGDTGPWTPLAASTQAERRRAGYDPEHPVLERTGTLRRSLVEDTGDTIRVETPTYFAIGSAVPSIVFHQSRDPRSRLPRRAVFSPTQDQKHALIRPLRNYVTAGNGSVGVPGAATASMATAGAGI